MLAVNGDLWTGRGEGASPHFPPLASLAGAALPTENMCSVALRLQYGRFSYYTGGDLTCDTNYGRFPWHDIETPVAEAAGAVSVAVANHHGYFDLYAGHRDVFATGMTPAALLTTERFSGRLASTDGHVVIRIPRGGDEFTVYVVNTEDESGKVNGQFGPFAA